MISLEIFIAFSLMSDGGQESPNALSRVNPLLYPKIDVKSGSKVAKQDQLYCPITLLLNIYAVKFMNKQYFCAMLDIHPIALK
ncbi:hypothetical protein AT251_13320 [Enterovibrio nigricans]|nr:hypothetical protein AT251_13320 [Enterovibrio nigricans]